MFFSTYVLTKKGPLAKVWLAAHWDKRLTRNEVKVVDLCETILHIIRPVVPIALRTSGELLVGVVRIYALKVRHLLKEATEATLLLRVTTTTAKASRSTVSGKEAMTTSVDGLLVHQKGEVEAVTLNWSTEAAAKHGSMADAAEALCEARFDAIADLLGEGKRIDGPGMGSEDGLLASAWYTVQPTSQATEEQHTTQQDYDEIARMRADLMAFGERASGSASTNKSKSSLSSIEKGRGSVVDMDGMPLPPITDELDIGVPLPDELPHGFLPMADAQLRGGASTDPFLLPDMMAVQPTEDAAASGTSPYTRGSPSTTKKVRPVNILDLTSTTLSREAFEKTMADRGDIVHREPRRGPYDYQEEADRYTIAGTTDTADAALTAVPFSLLWNPSLRAAYAAALEPTVAAAMAEVKRAPRYHRPSGEAELPAGAPAEEEEAVAAADGTYFEREEVSHLKRGREEDGEEDVAGGLPASVVQTLKRISVEVAARNTAQGRKKARAETAASLVGRSCTLRGVCQGMRRRDAARTFVDMLALASKQYISVQQATESDEVQLTLNGSAVSQLAAAS